MLHHLGPHHHPGSRHQKMKLFDRCRQCRATQGLLLLSVLLAFTFSSVLTARGNRCWEQALPVRLEIVTSMSVLPMEMMACPWSKRALTQQVRNALIIAVSCQVQSSLSFLSVPPVQPWWMALESPLHMTSFTIEHGACKKSRFVRFWNCTCGIPWHSCMVHQGEPERLRQRALPRGQERNAPNRTCATARAATCFVGSSHTQAWLAHKPRSKQRAPDITFSAAEVEKAAASTSRMLGRSPT